MQWAQRAALASILLGCASTAAIAANVDLIGANKSSRPQAQQIAQNTNGSTQADTGQDTDGQWIADARTGCRVFDTNYDDGDEASWSGQCHAGLAEGAGTLTFSSGGKVEETISANLHRGNVQDGHVVATWADGSKYDGEEKGGHMNGMGVFTNAQGDRLEGHWIDDELTGNVRVAWANGDRYTGDWKDGKANGTGTEIWTNGDRYDGQWRDGKADGVGAQKWADGRSYKGQWRNDEPLNEVASTNARPATPGTGSMTAVAAAPAQAVASAAPAAAKAASPMEMLASAPMASAGDSTGSQGKVAILDGLSGTRLVSVDGSSIAFTAHENGFTREIARPDGAALATSFVFINNRLGTVANSSDETQTIGLFRLTDSEIDVDYADGRSEVLTPNPGGGLSIALAAPDGRSYCMSWYPDGHVFSDAEKKAAVAAYADRLGEKGGAGPAQAGSCAGSATARSAVEHAASQAPVPTPTVNLQNVPRPIPKPTRVSFVTPVASPLPTSSRDTFARDTSGVVVLRESNVHTIDAGADPMAPASPQAMLEQPNENASSCLSVESDGAHWGFRNSCGYSVQFSYCLMGASGTVASCTDGGIAGSVAAKGFGDLVADKSFQENGNEHDFRWVGCRGGAGEVVPHLDKTDPPAGRCVKPRAS
jgi:hypothetical protein